MSFVNLEVVSNSKHLVASLADFLSINLRDGELIRLIFIVASGNWFYRDFYTKYLMLCYYDTTPFGPCNLTFESVLLKLRIETLGL